MQRVYHIPLRRLLGTTVSRAIERIGGITDSLVDLQDIGYADHQVRSIRVDIASRLGWSITAIPELVHDRGHVPCCVNLPIGRQPLPTDFGTDHVTPQACCNFQRGRVVPFLVRIAPLTIAWTW